LPGPGTTAPCLAATGADLEFGRAVIHAPPPGCCKITVVIKNLDPVVAGFSNIYIV
jgi:hypothetical protein